MGKSPPRLAQVLTQRQHRRLTQLIPKGDRRRVFSVIIDGLIELLESKEGPYVLGAILSGRIKVQTVIDSAKGKSIDPDPEWPHRL